MAILGFHFSKVYKEHLIRGIKTATVMPGQHQFNVGEEVQIYVSDKDNLLEGRDEKRIGKAIIEKVDIKRARELTNEEAKNCGSKDLDDLKLDLMQWYGTDDTSVITYIKFKTTIFDNVF